MGIERIYYVKEGKMTDEEVEVPNEEESANYKVSFHMEKCSPPGEVLSSRLYTLEEELAFRGNTVI